MYNIERMLQEMGFILDREYSSGVRVYSDVRKGREFTSEVALFTKKEPKVFEVSVINPYNVTLMGHREYDYLRLIDTHKILAERAVEYAAALRDNLNILEPFEEWNPDD